MFGSILGAVGSVVGGLIGADSQSDANQSNSAMAARQIEFQREANQKAMDFGSAEADKNRAWQANLSNTAYQRAVSDMRLAGLNPMLGYSQGGASTPTGATPSGVTSAGAQADIKPVFTPQSFASAAQMASIGQQIDQSKATVANIAADTTNKLATTAQIQADTRLKNQQSNTEGYRPQLVTSQAQQSKSISEATDAQLLYLIDKLKADTRLSSSTASQIDSQRVLMKQLQGSGWTKDWAPYLLDALRSGR